MWPRTATVALASGLRVRGYSLQFAGLLLVVLIASGCTRNVAVAPGSPDAAAVARITTPPEATSQLDALVAAGPAVALGRPLIDNPSPPADGPTADVPIYSLADAIELALRNNPRLRVAAEGVERARGQSEVAFAPFLPEIELFTRIGQSTSALSPGAPGPVGGIIPTGDGSTQFAQAEVDLQWTLWDFGRREGRYGQAMSRERIAALQLARARETVAFDVTAAYLGVLQAQAARNIQEQAIRRARAALEDARVRRGAGVAEKDDVLRADLLVAEARDAAVVAGQAEYNAIARLNYALGRNPGLPLRVIARDSLPNFAASLDECLKTAAGRREEVAIARETISGARSGLEVAEGDFLPYVFVRLGIGEVGGDGVRTGFNEGAGLHLNQTLFAGGRRLGQRDSARADVRAATASADVIFDTIALEVHVAYRAVTASVDRIRLAESAVVQAGEYLRLIRVRYQNGNASPIDIVDAETEATRSNLRYQATVFEHLTALARLDYAMGTPQESFGDHPMRAERVKGNAVRPPVSPP